MYRTAALPIALLLASTPPVVAQRPVQVVDAAGTVRTVAAVRLEEGERIRLDGRLDEPVWARIAPITQFSQQEPEEGAAPSELTEVRIAYDPDNLYIGVVLHDGEPERILAHQRQRNAGLGTDDRFMWILDTFRDGRTGYFFEINPAGLMGDGLLRAGGSVNKSWDGIWEARVQRGEFGWSAEIRIPFRTLNFNPSLDAWGINFQRTIRRRNEELLWSGHRRNQGLLQPAHAGRLAGLDGISQGLGIELKPYGVASGVAAGGADGGWHTPTDAGFDLNYSVTSSLRASLSINTDFAEVEVDQRRVNLTRFPLRFPERREFFLEGSSVFDFAPDNGVEPYFSRRIGLTEGAAVPIRYGGRLTGQAGAYDLGVLQVRTGSAHGRAGEQFSVARVVRNVLDESSVGAVYTRRAPVAGGAGAVDHHTVGADLTLFTSRFRGDRNLRFQLFGVWHNDAEDAGTSVESRTARGLRLTYPNDPWRGHVSYRELGEHYDPAVGFTSRRGFRRLQPTLVYAPRPAWLPAVRQLEFGVSAEYLTDMQWRPQTRSMGIGLLGVWFESGDRIGLDLSGNRERIDRGFRLHPDTAVQAVVEPGEYGFGGWQLDAATTGRRAVSGELSYNRGGFWGGRRTRASGALTVRPATGVNLNAGLERNRIRLPEAEFTTDLLLLGSGWHVSPWISLDAMLQSDNLTRSAGLQTRFRWILRPGSDLFVVYGHNWRRFDGRLETLERAATTKLTYTHRF